MKQIKLLFFTFLLSIMACTPDSDDRNFLTYDYTGDWQLSSLSIISVSNNIPQTEEFRIDLPAYNNCLNNSSLSINEDNTAILTLTSTVNANIEIVDPATNELEQTIDCENLGSIREFTWEKVTNTVIVPIGPTTPMFNVIETIKFYDENNDLAFIASIHEGDVLYILKKGTESVSVEGENETFSYNNTRYLFLNR